MLTPVTEDGEWRTPEDHAVATRRHARVRAWLRAMPDRDAGILQCAYLPHPWPILLARELGRLTGIVVRLSCDRATWPEPRGEQLAVDAQNADRLVAMLQTGGAAEKATLRGLAREARAIFARALGRYAAARGRS